MDVDFEELEREFQLDNDPDDEFEMKLQESYKLAKGTASRPMSSSSNRPQTASRSRPEFSTSPKISVIPDEILTSDEVFAKISQHLRDQLLDRPAATRTFKEFCTFNQLKQGLASLGLEITDQEVEAVFESLGVTKNGMLRIGDFFGKIFIETEEEAAQPLAPIKNEPEKLRHEAQKLLETSHKRINSQLKRNLAHRSDRSMKRPFSSSYKSGSSSKSHRPISAYTSVKRRNIKIDDLDQEIAALEAREASLLDTRGKQFLKVTKKRQETHEKELAQTVDRCRREFEYDCLHKMGEANEIAQTIGLPTTYRAIKKESGVTMCHIYSGDSFVEEITLENFLREARRLKRLQKPAINPQPSADKSAKTSTTGGKINKKERQEELKNLLLETKELTNKLKEQLKVLERKGIIGKSLHTSIGQS